MLAVRGGARGLAASSSSSRHALPRLLRPLTASYATGPPPVPPPGPKPGAPPPAAAAGGGVGVGGAFVMASLAAGVVGTGYYHLFADQSEKANIDAKIAEVERLAGEYLPFLKKADASKGSGSHGGVVSSKQGTPPPVLAPEARVPPEEPVTAPAAGGGGVKKGGEKKTPPPPQEAVGAPASKAGKKSVAVEEEAELVEEAVTELEEAKATITQQLEHGGGGGATVQDAGPPSVKKQGGGGVEQAAGAAAAGATAGKKGVQEASSSKGGASLGQVATDAAAERVAQYQERAKGIRIDTLSRAAEEALVQGQALAKHLEASLLKDLNNLDADGLKLRIVQLTGEMQERTKWEAFRLHETVRKSEGELSGKYTSLIENLQKENLEELARQAKAFETEKQLALKKLVEEKEAELTRRLAQETEALQKTILAKFQEQRNKDRDAVVAKYKTEMENAVWEVHDKAQKESTERLKELQDLKSDVQALKSVFTDDRGYEKQSARVHKLTAAVLAFQHKLSTSEPIFKELQALKKITQGEELVQAALSSLPANAGGGVPTVSELQVRFPKVMAATREASFVPESSPGMVGHMFGSVLANITIKPKGLVDGPGTDETLARAAYYVERGDLASSIKELSTIQGLPANTIKDWLADAHARLVVEQVIKVLDSHTALLNKSVI